MHMLVWVWEGGCGGVSVNWWVHVCLCVWLRACVVCMCVCMCACMCADTCVRIRVCGYVCACAAARQQDGTLRKQIPILSSFERWGAGVETQKNVQGEIGGWGRVPFNEPYAPSLSTIYDGA